MASTLDGLSTLVLADVSRGMFPSVAPELIPRGGVQDIINGLLDEEGVVYRRGATTYACVTAAGLPRMLWSGFLKNGGQQTILATNAGTYRLKTDKTLESLGFTIATTPRPDGTGTDGVARPVVFQGILYMPGGHRFDGTTHDLEGISLPYAATAANRLLGGEKSRIIVSKVPKKEGEAIDFKPEVDYISLPGGSLITGMQGMRTGAAIFTTEGIWVISGLNHNIVDADGNGQWSQDLYAPSAVAWGNSGIAGYQGGLVVPCHDDIYLMEAGVSSEVAAPFVNMSKAIQSLYRSYVAAGYAPGGAAVYRSHYFLPILGTSDVVLDVLVCRLDATDGKGNRTFPWTHLSGFGAQVVSYAATDQAEELLGLNTEGKLLRTDRYFTPAGETDADTSNFGFSITYPDVPTGNAVANTVVKARVRYQLAGAGHLVMQFGPSETLLPGQALADPTATAPYTWHPRKNVRLARVKVSLVGSASTVSIRSLELAVRQTPRRW